MARGLRAMLINGKRNNFFASALILLPSIIFFLSLFNYHLSSSTATEAYTSMVPTCSARVIAPNIRASDHNLPIPHTLHGSLDPHNAIPELDSCSIVQTHQDRCPTLGHDTARCVQSCGRIWSGVGLGIDSYFRTYSYLPRRLGAVKLPRSLQGGATWNIFLVTAPLLAALTFGTRRDIMSVYAFWKRKNSEFQADLLENNKV
ncbi:hypothetical protein B0H19DRAFT_1162482 [Mycena capillaripes]|nr:hypothetical protein B0H19DRAFT_1162482 [Mycena capillaripes]